MTILRAALSMVAVCIALATLPARPALADDVAILQSGNYGLSGAMSMGARVAIGSTGIQYVTGQFAGTTITFGDQVATQVGTSINGFVATLDASGTPTMAAAIGGTGDPAVGPKAIAVAANGNYYVAGRFSGAGLTSPAAVALAGNQDGFVIRYDSLNSVVWAKAIGGTNATTEITGLAVDASGDVYVTGYFRGGNLSGTLTLARSNSSSTDGFVAKLGASNGNQTWVEPIAGAGGIFTEVTPNAIAVDASNNVYVGGHFGTADLATPTLNLIGGVQTGFVLRYSSIGVNNWRQAIGGTGGAVVTGNGLAVDTAGNVTFVGGFYNGNLSSPVLSRLTGGTDSTGFVINAVPSGPASSTFNWSKAIGGSGATATIANVALDGSGNAHVSGFFSAADLTSPAVARIGTQTLLTTRLAAADGAFVAPMAMGGAAVSPGGIAADTAGNSYLAGFMTGAMTTPPLTAIGTTDVLLVKYGPRYTLTASKAGTGSGTVTANAGALSCGATCSDIYANGLSVTLTAAASAGSIFAGWSVDCAGAATTASVTMSVARNCTATFNTGVTPTPPAPTPSPTPAPPTVELPINTAGAGQGSVSLAAALGNPGPNATYVVQQTSGAALPTWLSFDAATTSFSYNVPLPSDLPIQPAAVTDTRAMRSTPPNLVYPLAVLVQTVPVSLTVNGQAYVINMDFYAPRATVAATALSYSAGGRSGDGASGKPAISWDGGQVLFETAANNLFGAISTETKIARYHGLSGNRDLLSQTAIPGGGVANAAPGPATAPAVSANGAFGVFAAAGGGVTLNPASPLKQIYRAGLTYPRVPLNEAVTSAPVMVSTTPAGVPANAAADRPAISQDGNFVAFESAATNLGWNQGGTQVWRKNMAGGGIVIVSANAQGVAGNGDSRNVSLSWDGRFAAFESTATNLVAGAVGAQIYLKDLATSAIFVIAPGVAPKLDARATSVVFVAQGQVQRFDVATGRVTTLAPGDQPSVSADGRFVAWRADGTNGFTQIWVRDVFRNVTALASQTLAGTPGSGNSYDPAVSGDGASIAFGSQARDLVNGNPLPGQIHLAGNPLILPARTAHWYVPSGGNQAWAIERWGDRAYAANLAYQAGGGVATWVAGLCAFADLGCKGTLNPGGMTLATWFPEQGQTVASVNGAPNLPLQLYPVLGPSTTVMPGLPQGGWWYEPANAAANNGIFLQFGTQIGANGTIRQTAHLSLLTYDPRGVPVWYATEGTLGPDLSLEATLYAYAGGAPVGQMTGGVVPSAAAIGTVRLGFAASDSATLRLPDGSTRSLARFRF